MKKSIIPLIALLSVSNSYGVIANISTTQYVSVIAENINQVREAAANVQNLKKQLEQFSEELDINKLTNSILGEYGNESIDDIRSIVDTYEAFKDVSDLTDIVDIIEVDDVFTNTSGGIFAEVDAPDIVDEEKYKGHAAVESAFQSAIETQTVLKESNIQLAETAKAQREAAAIAPDEATYQQHIDKAEAAEGAIDRNNAQIKSAIEQVESVQAAAEDNAKKAEKAAFDRAVQGELNAFVNALENEKSTARDVR